MSRLVGVILLVSGLLETVQGHYEPICDPEDYRAPLAMPFPQIPQQFSTVVEANFVESRNRSNSTVNVVEYFDTDGNRGRMEFSANGFKEVGIFDYDDGEIFFIPDLETGDDCSVRIISESDPFVMVTFGFMRVNGSVHIGTVQNFFDLSDNTNATYIGTEWVRGIFCNRWQTCTTLENNSFTLDYYFSVEDWDLAYNNSPIPVQIVLNASRLEDGNPENIYHIYNFVNFNSGPDAVPEEVFQVPIGLVCTGRIPGLSLPTLPVYFSTYIEAVVENDDMEVDLVRVSVSLFGRFFFVVFVEVHVENNRVDSLEKTTCTKQPACIPTCVQLWIVGI